MRNRGFSNIRVVPPGPKAREILRRDESVLMQSYVRWFPLVISRGDGFIVEDVDGNRYIDFNAGIAVLSTGHRHPKVIEAVKTQLDRFIHYSLTDFYYELAVKYGDKLLKAVGIDGKLFYTNSGTESIEAAMKISKGFFGGSRNYFLAFIGGFHGRTLGSLSLTASKPIHRRFFFPMVPGAIHAPYPYCYRCPFKLEYPSCGIACLDYVKEWLLDKFLPGEELAAAFIEPIAGEGGYIEAPKEFMEGLSRMLREYGALMVVDEVQSGFGRTGRLFGYMHSGVAPDIIASAKGIASGFPLGVVIGRKEVMSLPPGTHANTFGGNPVSLAAADATLDLILDGLMDNAARLGEYILDRLREMMGRYEFIGDVRGKGLMIGVELVRDRDTKEPAPELLDKVVVECFKRGLLIIGAGRSVLRISPPLNITREAVDEALDILEDVFRMVGKEL